MQKGVNINGTQLPIEELHLSFLVDKLRNEFGFLESSRSSIPVDGYGNVMPLYSYPCYEYIRSMDWKNANIFEFGCGYSSIWWDNVDANVYGVDSNDEWINKIQSSVSGHLNIELANDGEEYTTSIYRHNLKYDVIVIDGMYRYDCVEPSLDCLANDGMVILDNSEWHTNTKELLDNSDLMPVHFHGMKPIHVDIETTSCYISSAFNRTPKSILPMGGTQREPHPTDSPASR